MNNDKSDFSYYKTFALTIQLGLIMVSSIFISVLLGLYLGNYFGNRTLGIILGVIIGIISGFFAVYKNIKKVIDITK